MHSVRILSALALVGVLFFGSVGVVYSQERVEAPETISEAPVVGNPE